MAMSTTSSREQLTSLLQTHFSILMRNVGEGFFPETNQPRVEIGEQRAICDELINELHDQIEANHYSRAIKRAAAQMLGMPPVDLVQQPRHIVADACSGVARAEIEALRHSIFRLTERLLPYIPADPLFAGQPGEVPAAAPAPLAISAAVAQGPSLSAVVEHHLTSGKAKWTAKTLAGKTRMLGYLVEHLDPNKPITSVTPDDIRSFKAAITRLRSNHRASKAQSFAEKQTTNENHRIAHETILNIYNPIRAFFAWATNVEGYLSTNPAANVRIEKPKTVKGAKSRRPFTAEELTCLFSAPVFTGCKSARFRFLPGNEVCKDDHFWIPILGYYTGARLGELVQLHLKDVVLDGPIPHIEITETPDEKGTEKDLKHLKSAAAVRKFPIHPDLLSLGFGEFVTQRRKRKKSVRLFHLIRFGADGQASTVFSKWFARLADKQGLTDPTLTFHSFRHGVQDAYRNALHPQYVIDSLFGHSNGKTAEKYGAGVSMEVLTEAVKSMKLPISLPNLLGV